MTQKQKGYAGLGAMLVLAVGTIFGSEPLYKAIDTMTAEKVDYTPGTYVGSAQGFGGEVVATVTVGNKGIEAVTLTGAGETPALGGTALEQLAPMFVEVNGSKVDAVSGSTISSEAAMAAVQQALDQASGKLGIIDRPAAESEAETEAAKENTAGAANYKPGTYEGSAKGFGGDIKAVVTIDESGSIKSVELTGDGETPGLGLDALKTLAPAFEKAGSAQVDAVSGSTVTSKAAMEAVQAALDQAAGSGAAEKPAAEAKTYKPGTYEGTAKGFGGDIKAVVTVGESGSIESVELTGDDETPGLGLDALKTLAPAFKEAGSAQVDAVSGSTVTSEAAMKAVEAALSQAADDSEAAQSDQAEAKAGSFKPGTYEGTAKGFGGDIKAVVTVGESGSIESVELTGDDETPGLGLDALKTLAPAFKEAGSAQVDAVSGSTVTSEAAMKAVEAALSQAK